MITKILIVLAVAIAAFVVVVAMQPAKFRITRSTVLNAPPNAVFAKINDFREWEAWSPWAKLDPNVKATFEGPASGKGSVFKWSGNNKAGEGVMTITESQPAEKILINLEFIRPFQATNLTEFTFAPEANGTRITWSMSGENQFIGKAMGLIMNCDKMMGKEFEKGFANLQAALDGKPVQ